jgi:hypothetical protein
LAAERGDPLPAKFVKRAAPHLLRLLAAPPSRSRIDNWQGFLKAALCRAINPRVSWNKLAEVTGVAPGTLRQWHALPQFQKWVNEAKARMDARSARYQDWKKPDFLSAIKNMPMRR